MQERLINDLLLNNGFCFLDRCCNLSDLNWHDYICDRLLLGNRWLLIGLPGDWAIITTWFLNLLRLRIRHEKITDLLLSFWAFVFFQIFLWFLLERSDRGLGSWSRIWGVRWNNCRLNWCLPWDQHGIFFIRSRWIAPLRARITWSWVFPDFSRWHIIRKALEIFLIRSLCRDWLLQLLLIENLGSLFLLERLSCLKLLLLQARLLIWHILLLADGLNKVFEVNFVIDGHLVEQACKAPFVNLLMLVVWWNSS